MTTSRALMMGTGALAGLALTLVCAFIVFPTPVRGADPMRRERHAPRCTRDTTIRVERICGQKVYWTNPDGSVVYIGSASDLEKPHGHVLMSVETR